MKKAKKRLTKTERAIKFLRSRKHYVIPPTGNHLFVRGPANVKLLGVFDNVVCGEGSCLDWNGFDPLTVTSGIIRDEYMKHIGERRNYVARLFKPKEPPK